MPDLLLLLIGAVLVSPGFVVAIVAGSAERANERRRTDELLRLLEAKAAPAEVAAYVATAPPAEPEEWIASDDGLVVYRVED